MQNRKEFDFVFNERDLWLEKINEQIKQKRSTKLARPYCC